MTEPHSSRQFLPEMTGTPHSNEPVTSETVLETTTVPQSNKQAVPVLTPSSPNVTNMGMVPFANASNFVMNNPTFYDPQAVPNYVASAMKALSKRAIDGAEYDSSARDPPPSCHPGTRVELLNKIQTWFYDKGREKAFLWLSGPAGVGKSAVIQTLAESLAGSESLGTTLFFSRLNDRKDPQRVVATIAFQLATRIPAYRSYVTKNITLDPSLLRKGVKEQFRVFIGEPFGNNGIGKGEGPWGILLDGLDECEGMDQQCEIICLVSEFVLKFPDAPLVWSISSRPEPNIVGTFASSAIALNCWSEYVPINSTEGCKDVERYLNENFERMRNQFPHVPRNWPKETQFLKLSHGALGLFIFARTAVRFMEDPNHANPVSRLEMILSVIDRLVIAVTDEHPFALLDVLYHHILKSIPLTLWPTTKRILGFFICAQPRKNYRDDGLSYPLESRSLMAASIILHIEQHVMYSSLHKLHSVLEIPHPDVPHESGISFFHASFGDYLTDSTRSIEFSVDRGESVDDITRGLANVYIEAPWDKGWAPHTSQLPTTVGQMFYEQLQQDTTAGLLHAVTGDLRWDRNRGPFGPEEDRSECLDILDQIKVAELYWSENGHFFVQWLFELWRIFPEDLQNRGSFEMVPLLELTIDHLEHEENICAVYPDTVGPSSQILPLVASVSFQDFETKFQSLQRRYPEKGALVYGISAQRHAFIQHDRIPEDNDYRESFYCFPYPYPHLKF